MLKIASAVAATALTVGTVGFNAYHTLYVKMNQAQAAAVPGARESRGRVHLRCLGRLRVRGAAGDARQVFRRRASALGSQYLARGATSPEPSLAQAKVESP